MSAAVTVVCATRNALDAVRLTFSSFRRCTPEPCEVLIADNGSTDGTLEYLRSLPFARVVPLEERLAPPGVRDELAATAASLRRRLDGLADGLAPAQRVLLERLRGRVDVEPALEPDAVAEHGRTLDWLVARVRTPLVLTLDSDVEFLTPGWLGAMLDLAERERLAALGVLEPGWDGYRPRLAPHLLLLRTATLRGLGVSFRGHARFGDAGELERWAARAPSFALEPGELDAYRTARIYPVGAALFERLYETGAKWRELPDEIARCFRHLGHMSWSSADRDEFRRHHAAQLAYARSRLAGETP